MSARRRCDTRPAGERLSQLLGGAFVALLLLWIGCRSAGDVTAPSEADSTHVVHLVEHGWHAGIVIHRADIAPGSWDVLEDFPDARYFEVGWGDAEYYQADDPGLGTLLKAGLWPTESVLHVAAFRDPPADAFPHRTVIRIPVSTEGLEALLAFVRSEHARDDTEAVIPLSSGLYGDGSLFYAAQSRYHVFNNCNNWAARALQEAGCTMAPAQALTVEALLAQARDCGSVIQERD